MNPVTHSGGFYEIGGERIDGTEGGEVAVVVSSVTMVLPFRSIAHLESVREQGQLNPTQMTFYKLVIRVMTPLGAEADVPLDSPSIRVLWVKQDGKKFSP